MRKRARSSRRTTRAAATSSGRGRYVEMEEEELDAIKIESTHTIEIDSFVPKDDIDERYLNKPYYIAPDGKAALEPYVVIQSAMEDEERVALGRIVLASREHILAIEPLGKGLLGTTLHYDYEMRDEKDYFSDIRTIKIPKEMRDLASHILATKAGRFDPSKFKDRYEVALKTLVKCKAAGKPIQAKPQAEPSNVVNLMDALRRSVEGEKGVRRKRCADRRLEKRPAAEKRPRRRNRIGSTRSGER